MNKIFNVLIATDDITTKNFFIELYRRKEGINIVFSPGINHAAKLLYERTDYHLIFIDYKLKDSNGLTLLSFIRGMPSYSFCQIIFISDILDHLITAFKNYHCYDYFVKPLDPEDIFQATSRILTYLSNYNSINNERESIIFKFRNKALKIFVNDIYFIETSRQKCLIHTSHGKNNVYDIYLPFNKILNIVSEFNIIQVHRSFAVNVNNIKYINKSKQPWEVVFYGYEKIALVSRKYKDIIIEFLEKH